MIRRLVVFLTWTFLGGFAGAEPTVIKAAGVTKPQSSSEGSALWKKFISCGSSKLTGNASECMKSVASKKLNPLELTRLHEFVHRGFEVTELADCTAKEEKTILDADKKNHLCFKILGNKSETTGYCYFDRENGALKITQIRY